MTDRLGWVKTPDEKAVDEFLELNQFCRANYGDLVRLARFVRETVERKKRG